MNDKPVSAQEKLYTYMFGYMAGAGVKQVKTYENVELQSLFDEGHKRGRDDRGKVAIEAAKRFGASLNILRAQ